MYRWYIRRFRSLSVLQHIVVFLTTFTIPVAFELVQGWQDTGLCLSCVSWGELALYFVFYQIAMLLIASVTRRDRARVEEELAQTFSELTDSINQLREDHQEQMTGIQERVSDLREWVRELRGALCDELGVDLPPLTHSIRASVRGGGGRVSVGLTVVGSGGRRVRLLRWLKRQVRNLQRWARKILVDWEEG